MDILLDIVVFFPGQATLLMGSYFPDPGLNPGPSSESRVLTIGPPGNSLDNAFFFLVVKADVQWMINRS